MLQRQPRPWPAGRGAARHAATAAAMGARTAPPARPVIRALCLMPLLAAAACLLPGPARAQGAVPTLRPSMPEPANPVHDAAITANVNAALAHDEPLAKMVIDVETVNGQVALRGDAPNAELRDRATMVAAQVPGVVSVENRLAILRPAPISPR